MLKAGTAVCEISPARGVQLAGYPHCPRENEGIHDPLYAAALYLNDGKHELILVTVDLLYISKDVTARVRERVGIPLTITATHTHCGPWVTCPVGIDREEGISRDEAYVKELEEKLVLLCKEAAGTPFSAEAGTGIGRCGAERGIGGNRRQRGGICDDSVNVLCVRDLAGKTRAILANYALHPTYLHAENVLVTADYPGAMRNYLRYAAPDAVFLFAQGTSGDQSSRYHRTGQNFEEAVRAGTTLACEVDRVRREIGYSADFKVGIRRFEISDLPRKVFPSEAEALVRKREKEAAYRATEGKDYITRRNAELDMFGAQNTYSYILTRKNGEGDEELPYEVDLVTLGDTLLVELQGEIFVRYGLEIKTASPAEKTFVFEVSNGSAPGYIHTPDSIADGGYEVGNSTFAPDAGERLLERIREEMKHVCI